MHAEICPVCGGEGELCEGIDEESNTPILKTCHGCGGRGWVEVSDEEKPVKKKYTGVFPPF